MKLSGIKKILLLGLILIIIAGVVVVALKGFKVSLFFEQHESLNLVIGKEVNINDVKNICKDVFKGKEVIVKKLELFDDSVNINVESITDEEKSNLVQKINEKYQTEFTVEGITVNSNANVRLRDIVRPYITPLVICTVVIVAYILVRYRKLNSLKFLGKLILVIVLSELFVASIILITRFPITPVIINVMIALAVLEVVLAVDAKEKEYMLAK